MSRLLFPLRRLPQAQRAWARVLRHPRHRGPCLPRWGVAQPRARDREYRARVVVEIGGCCGVGGLPSVVPLVAPHLARTADREDAGCETTLNRA